MAGQDVARLGAAVQPMNPGEVDGSQSEWERGADKLQRVATALRTAGPAMERGFGGQTGVAARQAFERIAEKAELRAQQMSDAAGALSSAKGAMEDARTAYDGVKDPPAQPAPLNIPPDASETDRLRMQSNHTGQVNAYNTQMSQNDEAARVALEKLNDSHQQSTDVMKKVHGIPDPPQHVGPPPSGGGATGGGGGTTTTPVTPVDFPDHDPDVDSTPDNGTDPTDPGSDNDPTVPNTPNPPVGVPPGTPPPVVQPPVLPPTGGPAVIGAPVGSSPVGGVGAVVGSVGIGALGAALAGGLTGGPRGGVPVKGGNVGAAGSGTRGAIGAGRGGVGAGRGPVLGGTPGSAARGSAARGAGGTAGRAGTAAGGTGSRGGGRSSGRGAGRVGAAGSRAGGAMAAGTRGRKRTEDRRDPLDLFDDGQDWVDDEDVAPGVLD